MTTIAYKDGVIACDSRITSDSFIIHDDYEKRHEIKGHQFVFTGSVCDYSRLADAWFGATVEKDIDCSALVFDGERLWYAAASPKDGICKTPVRLDRPYVLGSGGDHAITAMDMGASAEEAVKMAIKRDAKSGGDVCMYSLPLVLV